MSIACLPALHRPVAAPIRLLARLSALALRTVKRRRLRAGLARLDDAQLDDIGIRRIDIEFVVRRELP